MRETFLVVNDIDDKWPFERIIRSVSEQLGAMEAESLRDYVQSYLHHGEPVLAFEGLVSTLRSHHLDVSEAARRDLAYLARVLGATDYPDGEGIYW